MGFLTALLFCLSTVSAVLGCDYAQFGADHTMCKYQAQACGANPRGFSSADAALAVKLHNEKRQFVASGQQSGQPSASNMKKLVWDDELATIAQRWADQCKFDHDKNRNTKKFSYVGQNVFIYMSTSSDTKINMADAVDSWYNEVTEAGFNSNDISPYKFDHGSGHYTQLVWAETQTVGCGYSFYKDGEYNDKLIICNYGPGGNIINAAMYKIGPPCSACPNGCSADYTALCN